MLSSLRSCSFTFRFHFLFLRWWIRWNKSLRKVVIDYGGISLIESHCHFGASAITTCICPFLSFFFAQINLLNNTWRIKDISSRKILDNETRKRRQKRQLEALEKDNFQDDPHAHLTIVPAKMKVPAFNDTMEDKRKKRKSKTGELFKQRFRRTFVMLLEEAQQEAEAGEPSYTSAKVPPSKFPERHFCAVCGFPSNYICVSCGSRYCCVKCLGTHQDTRCLKWTV